MKKLSAILLILCIVLGLAACGSKDKDGIDSGASQSASSNEPQKADVFAAERTLSQTGGVSEKRTLANTYKCLTEKKELNVLYIGGSLTVGTGSSDTECWRAYTTKWLEETYPNAKINETNMAVGGTSSLWGLARTKRDVIAYNPDLVFIEFAINDMYFQLTEAQAATYMEGMIRQINTDLPNTDIIFVLTIDSAHLGKSFVTADGHIETAVFYGIPYINVGTALAEAIKTNNWSWSEVGADTVHLNAKGYHIYADEVIKSLENLLAEAKGKTGGAHKLPEGYISSNPAHKVTLMEPDAIAALNSEQWRYVPGKGAYYSNKNSAFARTNEATLSFEFDGTTLCVMGEKKDSGEIVFTIDGVVVKEINKTFTKSGEIMAVDNLKSGHHTVEIKVTSKCLTIDGFMVG